MADLKRARDFIKRADSEDIELLKEKLGLSREGGSNLSGCLRGDRDNTLDALRRGRNLEHKKQPLIEYHETIPTAGSYPEGSLIVSRASNLNNVYSFYIIINNLNKILLRFYNDSYFHSI